MEWSLWPSLKSSTESSTSFRFRWTPRLARIPIFPQRFCAATPSTPFRWALQIFSVVGKLNFLENSTRPDIAYAIHQCACFSQDMQESRGDAIIHLRKYLKAMRDQGIALDPNAAISLKCTSMPTSMGTGIALPPAMTRAPPSPGFDTPSYTSSVWSSGTASCRCRSRYPRRRRSTSICRNGSVMQSPWCNYWGKLNQMASQQFLTHLKSTAERSRTTPELWILPAIRKYDLKLSISIKSTTTSDTSCKMARSIFSR